MNRIREITASVADAVSQQTTAADEIGKNTQIASDGAVRATETIDGLSEASARTGGGAQEVISVARSLAEQSEVLSNRVDQFVRHIKAA